MNSLGSSLSDYSFLFTNVKIVSDIIWGTNMQH